MAPGKVESPGAVTCPAAVSRRSACGRAAAGYGERVSRDHTGVCRTVENFTNAGLAELALRIERELGPPFESHGATLKVRPVRISHLREVGEGVQLDLAPHDVKTWEWWGVFESDIEVRRRTRLSREWRDLRNLPEVERWLRDEADAYLARLRAPAAA